MSLGLLCVGGCFKKAQQNQVNVIWLITRLVLSCQVISALCFVNR